MIYFEPNAEQIFNKYNISLNEIFSFFKDHNNTVLLEPYIKDVIKWMQIDSVNAAKQIMLIHDHSNITRVLFYIEDIYSKQIMICCPIIIAETLEVHLEKILKMKAFI